MCKTIVIIPERGKFEIKLREPMKDGIKTCDVCDACVENGCSVAQYFDCSEYDVVSRICRTAYLKRI